MGSFAATSLLLLSGRAQEVPTRGEPAKLKGYNVYQRFPLTKKLNGVEGEIQLIQDVRLSAALRDRMWGRAPVEIVELDNPAGPFTKDPSRNAILRIVDRDGLVVEVAGGKLKWLEAVDKKTGQPERINVLDSLKTVWRVADAPRGTARDILQVACRPDLASLSDVSFNPICTRYSFDGKNWVKLERQEKGFAELDDLRSLLDRKPFP
jgi:hypothetical protein